MQVSISMTALPRSRVIADTGQMRTQSPHPTHRKGVTWDLREAAAMHSTREAMIPAVMKNFFMAVSLVKLVFAYTRDIENASYVFLIYYFQKEYFINNEYKKHGIYYIFYTNTGKKW
jgi:hypothetical protein